VRPLLNWTRADTEAACLARKLQPRMDASNSDTLYFRNRLRHELLPLLQQYNPQIRQALAKTALALQGDYELLNELLQSVWDKTVCARGPDYLAFDLELLKNQSPALRRNLFRKAAFQLKPGERDIDFEALNRAATLKPVDLAGGLKTTLETGRLYLMTEKAELPCDDWPQVPAPFSMGTGQASLNDDWLISCEEKVGEMLYEQAAENRDPWIAWLALEDVEQNLLIRNFQSGDRFEPLGMPRQTSKLTELFINQKIPKRLRAHWPLVCVNDEIIWVVGLRHSERLKLNAETRRAIRIRVYKKMEPV
jgi:tRNA(Ile)-lysidine synthase